VDEVCFLGPELGPLAAMLVSPEGGTWSLDEVTVASSRTNHTDRWGRTPQCLGIRHPAGSGQKENRPSS
jgi:hypothetical protein